MAKKKILIVSTSFYPQNSPRAFRTTELVKEFSRQGHDVTLITHKDKALHEPFEKEYSVKIKDLGQPKFKEINFKSSNKIVSLSKRLVRRSLLWLFEYPDIGLMFQVKDALKNESGYDLFISVAVPHPVHWGAAWAVRKAKKPIASVYVPDSGDPYMGVFYDKYGKPFWFKYLEKSWGKQSTYMAITNINMKQNYYSEFHDKIVEIPQGFKFEDYMNTEPFVKNKVPTFAFAGTFYKSVRNPTNFLKYLSTLKTDFKFVIYKMGPNLAQPFKEALGDKLEFREFIPRTQLLKELSKMDFLVNIGYNPVLQSPSKLIDYYFTGRPVLSFPDNNIDEKLIDEFLAGDYTRTFDFEDMEKFRIERVAKQFLDLTKP